MFRGNIGTYPKFIVPVLFKGLFSRKFKELYLVNKICQRYVLLNHLGQPSISGIFVEKNKT